MSGDFTKARKVGQLALTGARDDPRWYSVAPEHIRDVACHTNVADELDSNTISSNQVYEFAEARQTSGNIKFAFGLNFARYYCLAGGYRRLLLHLNDPNSLSIEHPFCSNASYVVQQGHM